MVKLFNQLAHGFGITAFGRLSQPLLRVFAPAQSFCDLCHPGGVCIDVTGGLLEKRRVIKTIGQFQQRFGAAKSGGFLQVLCE